MQRSVDIIFSIKGCSKPPTLPLREELNSNGFELVYKANNIIQNAAVAKEKKERLLNRARNIEINLERNKLCRNSKLKAEAINSIRSIIAKLEAIIISIEDETIPEHKILQYSNADKNYKDLNNSTEIRNRRSASFEMGIAPLEKAEVRDNYNWNVSNAEDDDIEKDIARILASVSETGLFSIDDDEESDINSSSTSNQGQDCLRDAQSTENKFNLDRFNDNGGFGFDYNDDDSDGDVDDTVCSLRWEGIKVDSKFIKAVTPQATSGVKSITYYYLPEDSNGPTQSRTIDYRDVELTTEEAVVKCKELTEHLNVMQLSLSDDYGDQNDIDDENDGVINGSSDLKWHKFQIDSNYISEKAVKGNQATGNHSKISYYFTSPEKEGISQSKSVRFKDVKPTADEAIEKCKALTQQVKFMQLSFSGDTISETSSTIREDNDSDRASLASTESTNLERTHDEKEYNKADYITNPYEATFAKIPLTKCQLLAVKRAEFRKNIRKQGDNQDGTQILYKGLHHSRSYDSR